MRLRKMLKPNLVGSVEKEWGRARPQCSEHDPKAHPGGADLDSIAIALEGLRKVYGVRSHAPGLGAAVRQLFTTRHREAVAVQDLAFRIESGERVALVGPPGSGKSTTIKMLAGILYPTSGKIQVLGLEPWKARQHLAGRVSAIFGQRNQLWAHLPVAEPLERLARGAARGGARRAGQRDRLIEAFALGPLLAKPRRQLSLVEHLRCEAVATLLHAPPLLLLDGLTVGLSAAARREVRRVVREQAERQGRTILLASDDVRDVEIVCDRVLVMAQGRVVLDCPVASLRSHLRHRRRLTLETVEREIDLALPGVTIEERSPHHTAVEIDTAVTSVDEVVRIARRQSRLNELRIAEPTLEEIVRELCATSAGATGAASSSH